MIAPATPSLVVVPPDSDPPPPPPPPPAPQRGVTFGPHKDSDVVIGVALAVESHIGWVRTEMNWNELQPHTYAEPLESVAMAWYSDFFTKLTNNGVKIYVVLNRTPQWVKTDTARSAECLGWVSKTDHTTNAELQLASASCLPDENKWQFYQWYVDSLLTRFPQVDTWGVWNEPNDTGFLKLSDTVGTATPLIVNGPLGSDHSRLDRYRTLALYTAGIVKSSSHNGRIAGPELGGVSTDGIDVHTWFNDFMARTAYTFDALTVHEYATGPEIVTTMDGYAAAAQSAGPWPVWLTEFGLEVGTDPARAHILTGVYDGLAARASSRWRMAFFFNMWDAVGTTKYNLVRNATTSTPDKTLGYYCLRALNFGYALPPDCR
jgi:hypothetical protein